MPITTRQSLQQELAKAIVARMLELLVANREELYTYPKAFEDACLEFEITGFTQRVSTTILSAAMLGNVYGEAVAMRVIASLLEHDEANVAGEKT